MRSRSRYIDGLYKIVEQEKQERELSEKKKVASPLPVKTLAQQLSDYFKIIPLSQAQQPLQISNLVLHLRGRYGQNPHPQLVAVELRKLGFERRRLYGAEFEGKRYWFPPAF